MDWVTLIVGTRRGSHSFSTLHTKPACTQSCVQTPYGGWQRREVMYCFSFACLFPDKKTNKHPTCLLELGIKESKTKATGSIHIHKLSPLTCWGFLKWVPPSSPLYSSTSSKETSQMNLHPQSFISLLCARQVNYRRCPCSLWSIAGREPENKHMSFSDPPTWMSHPLLLTLSMLSSILLWWLSVLKYGYFWFPLPFSTIHYILRIGTVSLILWSLKSKRSLIETKYFITSPCLLYVAHCTDLQSLLSLIVFQLPGIQPPPSCLGNSLRHAFGHAIPWLFFFFYL